MPRDDTQVSLFPQTAWTQLAKAASADAQDLDHLIRRYWIPLKIYLIATFPNLRNQAEELLQDFAEDKILKQDWLGRADRTRGRLRDFLKSSLRNFVLDRLNRFEARNPPLSLSGIADEMPAHQKASDAFDLAWAGAVLAQTLQRMEEDCKNPKENQPRRSYIWEMFRIRLLVPIYEDVRPVPYEELIERFQIKSPTDASNMLLSAKRIFKSHFNNVIEEYCEKDSATAREALALEEFVLGLAKTA